MAYSNGQRPSLIQQSCLEFKAEQFTYQELRIRDNNVSFTDLDQ